MNSRRLRPEAASAIQAVRVALQVIAARTDGDRTITKGRLDIATGTDLKSQAVIREVLERARGAWVDEGGSLVRISASERSATLLLDPGRPGGPAAMRAATVIAAAIRDGRWELRTLGTSLDLAYLAAGRVAGVWHFSRIPPLHFAAGTLLAAEAGALVTHEQGGPWTLDSTSLVAAATTTLHDELLALLPAAVGSGR